MGTDRTGTAGPTSPEGSTLPPSEAGLVSSDLPRTRAVRAAMGTIGTCGHPASDIHRVGDMAKLRPCVDREGRFGHGHALRTALRMQSRWKGSAKGYSGSLYPMAHLTVPAQYSQGALGVSRVWDGWVWATVVGMGWSSGAEWWGGCEVWTCIEDAAVGVGWAGGHRMGQQARDGDVGRG